jgi:hypothetical protein
VDSSDKVSFDHSCLTLIQLVSSDKRE